MKRSFLLIIALLVFNTMFANPVDVNRAKELGHKFVKANFEQKQNSDLNLVYTMKTDSGEPCFFVFNVSDYGFVIVSADDFVRPILGYSEDGIFDVNNIAPGLGFMMEEYQTSITYAIREVAEATDEVAAEWNSLEANGKLKPATRGEKVGPLCTTQWDQSWPYNYYCPEQPASWSSNGRSVVGCVATAMAQIMKYWNYPTQGSGSHSYKPFTDEYDYPVQTANFGETTYDWDNMPNTINANSPQEQIEAVALLSYHCGVSVNMMYDDDGTGAGAFSMDVPYALNKFFNYAQCTYREKSVPAQVWDTYIRTALEMHRPVYYSGVSVDGGGHAFICDGFDENGLFHFNYGWSGSGDGFFASTAIEYVNNVSAIFDIMPKDVFQSTADSPKNMTVVAADNNELSATITWTNPTRTINGATLSAIDKIVVERNGDIIHEVNNPAPGEQMTFVDNKVPCFSFYNYSVYAVVNGAHGTITKVENVGFGPTCKWQLVLQSSDFHGMRGANVTIFDEAGARVTSKTTTNSTAETFDINMPLGKVKFVWSSVDANQPDYTLTLIVKDYNQNTLFKYTGKTVDMVKGVFLDTINNCGYEIPEAGPHHLRSRIDGDKVVLSWYGIGGDIHGYNVFRDDVLIGFTKNTHYIDDDVPFGGHCYTVSALYQGGNSKHSNEACAVLTEGCAPAQNLRYELSQVFKPIIKWDKPANGNASGYYVMRKTGKDGNWMRIKVLGANKTSFTDNSVNTFDTWYYYKVIAYYSDTDCMSAPATLQDDENEFMISFYYSETGVEDNAVSKVGIYPNPANEKITIDAENMTNVTVTNLMGQKVYETSVNNDKYILNVTDYPTGIYMIKVVTEEHEVTKRVSIVH